MNAYLKEIAGVCERLIKNSASTLKKRTIDNLIVE
jgi:hypothetical protein